MRRKRNMTTQERIDSARELIAEKQNELAELKKQLSELEAQKEQEDLKELYLCDYISNIQRALCTIG